MEMNAFTIAVVAAPKMAMRDKTDTWPTKVAIASNTNTPYTYGCYKFVTRNYVNKLGINCN